MRNKKKELIKEVKTLKEFVTEISKTVKFFQPILDYFKVHEFLLLDLDKRFLDLNKTFKIKNNKIENDKRGEYFT